MKIPFGQPVLDSAEKAAVNAVLEGPILVHGPVAGQFEESFKAFCDAPYAVSVSSCTAGMHLIYFALGYGPGDEVIVPAQTHMATAHAVELTGAKAVFVDVEISTGNIAIDAIEAAITPRTKAIAVVHYLGVPVDVAAVVEIARKHDLFVLEDCALSPGAKRNGVHTGLLGDAGIFSFYPVKHLTTAEGGMVILRDAKLAERLSRLKAFGVDRSHGERKVPGIYDAPELGLNYRMSELHAAIGVEQMKKLPSFLKTRRENFLALEKHLSSIENVRVMAQPFNESIQSCYYCMAVILPAELQTRRGELITRMQQREVGCSVYYPHPVPRISYYREKYGYDESLFPNAALISDRMLALPVGPHLTVNDMETIAMTLKSVLEEMQ